MHTSPPFLAHPRHHESQANQAETNMALLYANNDVFSPLANNQSDNTICQQENFLNFIATVETQTGCHESPEYAEFENLEVWLLENDDEIRDTLFTAESKIFMAEVQDDENNRALVPEHFHTLQRLMSKFEYPYLIVPPSVLKNDRLVLREFAESTDDWFVKAGGFNIDLFIEHSIMSTYAVSMILVTLSNTHRCDNIVGNSMYYFGVKPGQFYPCHLVVDGAATDAYVTSDIFLMLSIADVLETNKIDNTALSVDVWGNTEVVLRDHITSAFSALNRFQFQKHDNADVTDETLTHKVLSVNKLARVSAAASNVLTNLFAYIASLKMIPSDGRKCLCGVSIHNIVKSSNGTDKDDGNCACCNDSTDEDVEPASQCAFCVEQEADDIAEGLFEVTIQARVNPFVFHEVSTFKRILYKCPRIPVRAYIITECLPTDANADIPIPTRIEQNQPSQPARQQDDEKNEKQERRKTRAKRRERGQKRKRIGMDPDVEKRQRIQSQDRITATIRNIVDRMRGLAEEMSSKYGT